MTRGTKNKYNDMFNSNLQLQQIEKENKLKQTKTRMMEKLQRKKEMLMLKNQKQRLNGTSESGAYPREAAKRTNTTKVING